MKERERIKQAVQAFAKQMEVIMLRHHRKGKRGWEDWPRAIESAHNELVEFEESDGSPDELIDVANFLMMEWLRAKRAKAEG